MTEVRASAKFLFSHPPADFRKGYSPEETANGWLLDISSVQTQLGRRSEQVHLGRVDLDLDGI
ncbi:MAG: hypothetical protein ACLTDO_08040, partial [Bifidobacterium pseudocatenulatum]